MIHWYWVWPERLIIKLSSNCWLVPGIIGHHRVKTSDSSMAGAGHRAVCGTVLRGILGTRRNLNKSWSSRVGERRGEGHHGSKPEDGDHEGRVMQGWARLWMWGGGRSGTQLRISENIINNRDQAHAWRHWGHRDTVYLSLGPGIVLIDWFQRGVRPGLSEPRPGPPDTPINNTLPCLGPATRAVNEDFTITENAPNKGFLLVECKYYHFHIWDTIKTLC